MEALHETIRGIRQQLRLAMNGVTAASMRDKGLCYKLNFGASYPEIKGIAQQHQPDHALAAALWAEDCRELKILATLLQPTQDFPIEEALRWVEQTPYPEIAEFLSKHLLARLPYMEELEERLFRQTALVFGRSCAFLSQAEYLKQGHPISPNAASRLVSQAIHTLTNGTSLFERRTALQALRFYGRQNQAQANQVLEQVQAQEATPFWQELYNDLKFEFDN